CSRSFASLSTQASICFLRFRLLRPPGSATKKGPTRLGGPPGRLAPPRRRLQSKFRFSINSSFDLFSSSLKHKMPRIDSKRLPLMLKRSCTDVLNPSLVYGYECVMLLVWCSFCHWLLSLCFQMADIVTEQ
ncbi:unnamed protein product, partial [Prunus brigantina]